MSSGNGAIHPLVRFLGVDPAMGPWAVLGLDEAVARLDVNQRRDAVMEALDRRMEQVRSHPDAASPDAERVLDALRRLAGELLNAERAVDEASVTTTDTAAAMSRDASLALAQFGGWNRRSMRRLAMIAARRGVDASALAAIVRGLGGGPVDTRTHGMGRAAPTGRTSSASTTAPPRPAPAMPALQPVSALPPMPPMPAASMTPAARPGSSIFVPRENDPTLDQTDPARRLVITALAVVGGMLILLIAAGTVVTLVLQAPRPLAPPATIGTGETGGDAPAAPAPDPLPVRPLPKPSPVGAAVLAEAEPGAILRAITTSVDALDLDANVASESFVEAVGAASIAWPRFAPDQIAAMQESIVEFVYRSASAGDAPAGAVSACLVHLQELTAGTGGGGVVSGARIAPAMFSAGIASRLLAEREMPSLAQGALRQALPPGGVVSLSAGSFSSGALAAGTALAAQMAQRTPLKEEAWRAWGAAVDPLVKTDVALASRVRLLALDALLAGPPDTVRDAAYARVIALLVAAIQWREGDESRTWLVRWLDSGRASPLGLSAVMDAMIDQSSAARIDVTMRLPASASVEQRAELRDRIAKLWGVGEAADRGETFKAWLQAADRVLPLSEDGAIRKFARAVVLSRLSEAAELMSSGDATGAATILGDLEGPVTRALERRLAPVEEAGADQGDWIARYAAAEKMVAPRLGLLGEVRGERVPAPIAEVVVGEALRSANTQVREAARELVRRHINSVEFVNALLEQLPTMARANDNAELVREAVSDSLPPVRDLSWRAAARRALVARLLDLLASDPESAGTEALANLLADSYRTRVIAALPSSEATGEESIAELGAGLRAQWRARAVAEAASGPQPALIAELDGRHQSRLALARGLVQRFAAAQVGAAEMMGAAIRSEQPSSAAKVELILAELTQARRRATDAMEQVDACEAAMVRLWALRLGGGGA